MKKIFTRDVLFFTFFCTILLGIGFIGYRLQQLETTLGGLARPARLFNPSVILSKFANRAEWDVKISPHHDRFFYVVSQQQLNWLGRGAQAFAFETQDGKYVVKFFQLGRVKDNSDKGFWGELFTKESKEKRQQRVRHREEIFSSSKMCFEELSDETGIVYVHLNRTRDKIKGIKLVDKFGQSHRIRGDDACFVVQKKASYLIPTLTKLMDSGQVELAQARLDQVFQLLLDVAKKGFSDGDDALIRNNNIGFSVSRAMYIDTGHIVHDPDINVRERMAYEFKVRLKPLENWLNVSYPLLASYYGNRQEEIMRGLTQEEEKKGIDPTELPAEAAQKNEISHKPPQVELSSVVI